MLPRPASKTRAQLWRVTDGERSQHTDLLATEEPMEIRLLAGGARRSLSVTMRTPGNDFELAAGFLFTEGILSDRHAIGRISYCRDPDLTEESRYNIVHVELNRDQLPDLSKLERSTFTSSACGVCGKAGLEALERRDLAPLPAGPEIDPAILVGLPAVLRSRQGVFEATGGLHAAALFDVRGNLLALREDVGRHNAVDKLIGWDLLEGGLPWSERIVLVSGRAGFEIVQKLIVAGAPLLCAISAPSSLAVDLARAFNLTLVGFLREGRFNLYSAAERIRAGEPLSA
jgi:FdhD protein